MKNNEENIDKLLRDRLSDRKFDGPPQDFLEDLNKRLDERDKAGFFGPWNGILDILLIVLLLMYPFIDSSSDLASDEKQSTARHELQIKEGSASEILKKKNSKENVGSSLIDDLKRGNQSTASKSTENDSKIVNADSSSIDNSTQTTNRSKRTKDESFHKELTKNTINNEGSSKISGNDRTRGASGSSNTPLSTDLKKKMNQAARSSTRKTEKEESSHPVSCRISNSSIYASQYPIVEPKIRDWNFPPILSLEIEIPDEETQNMETNNTTSPFGWEIQLSSGLNFPKLNNDQAITGSELTLAQQSGTSPSFTIGGRISMLWNNMTVTTGADLLSVKEENLFEFTEITSYDSTYVTSVDTTVVWDSTIQNWDTTYTYYYDSTTVTDTTVNVVPVNQQYTWLQIPLQVGYKFQLNKWAIIPRVGMNVAIGIRQTDKTYPNETFDQLSSYSPSAKMLLNLNGSIEVRREFGNWHIFARGDYQTGMRPILTGGYFERRYSGFRMNVGVGLSLD